MRCAEGIKVCPNTCNQWLQVYCRRCGLCTPQSAKLVRERRMTTSRQCEQWHCCGEWGGRGDNTHKNIPKLCCTDFKLLPFHSQLPEQHAANATEALWSAMHMQPAHMSITTQPKCAGSRCGISLPRHVIRPNIIL